MCVPDVVHVTLFVVEGICFRGFTGVVGGMGCFGGCKCIRMVWGTGFLSEYIGLILYVFVMVVLYGGAEMAL